MTRLAAFVIASLLLQAPPPRPQEPQLVDPQLTGKTEVPPSKAEVQKIIDEVKQTAEANAKADQEKARTIQETAEQAFRDGNLPQAVTQIRRAQRLNPESASIRQLVRFYEKLYASASEQNVNLNLARVRLDEALAHAQRLAATDAAQARAFALAVLEATRRFPATFNVAAQKDEARALILGGAITRASAPEALPLPESNSPPKALEAKEALKKRLSVSWLRQPLSAALAELSAQTGVIFIIDPELARFRWFDTRAITYSANDVTAERLLREIMDVAAMEPVPGKEGKVLLTTKRRALTFAVNINRAGADGAMQYPSPPPLRSFGPPSPTQRANGAALADSKPMPKPAAAIPDYLKSVSAFNECLDELLGPAPAKADPDRPLPNPPQP